jgi:BlaI family penicillinase repressor
MIPRFGITRVIPNLAKDMAMAPISPAESQIMQALWANGPMGTEELLTGVGQTQDWGLATVKTLINRLLKKKAIVSERADGKVRYRAITTQDDYITTESEGFLGRLFNGELAPLVAHYARHKPLKADELARLKKLIADMEDGDE